MDKFFRNYILDVQGSDGSLITIKLPFTIEFDVIRSIIGYSPNAMQVRIYNLNERVRNLLRFNVSNYGTYQSIRLRAGYGDKLNTIFFGNLSQGWSYRQGVDMITQLECYDGGFAFNNSRITGGSFPAGTTQREIIENLITQLQNVTIGRVGDVSRGDEKILRGNAYSGYVTQVLSEVTGGAFFIDNGIANVLRDNEYISTNLPSLIINAQSGLLNTPILEQTIVRFDMIFEPTIEVGHLIKLQSLTEKKLNGDFKVNLVKHRGMISDAVCGDLITSVDFSFFEDFVSV